jgi:proteasome lid subunit RPN8/RPN11
LVDEGQAMKRTPPGYGSLTDQFLLAELGPAGFLRAVAARSGGGVRVDDPPARTSSRWLSGAELRRLAPGPFSVTFPPALRQSLCDVIEPDGREDAAWLFGRWERQRVVVEGILPEREDSGRSSTHIELDAGRALEYGRAHDRQLIGCAHTHPGGTGTPSREDQQTMADLWRFTGEPVLGLILTYDEATLRRRLDPSIAAWVVDIPVGDQVVITRAACGWLWREVV